MPYEQEMQQARDLLDNFNRLDDETRDKLTNGVEWLAFLQGMAKTTDEDDVPALSAQPAI